jgi:hypothetical protein
MPTDMAAVSMTVVTSFLIPYVKLGPEKLAAIVLESTDANTADFVVGVVSKVWQWVASFLSLEEEKALLVKFQRQPDALRSVIELTLQEKLTQDTKRTDELLELINAVNPETNTSLVSIIRRSITDSRDFDAVYQSNLETELTVEEMSQRQAADVQADAKAQEQADQQADEQAQEQADQQFQADVEAQADAEAQAEAEAQEQADQQVQADLEAWANSDEEPDTNDRFIDQDRFVDATEQDHATAQNQLEKELDYESSQKPYIEKSTLALVRLDTAVPDQVLLNRVFDLAVAVKLPTSPILNEDDLPHVKSGVAQVFWPKGQPFISLHIQVRVPECEIQGSSRVTFRLYPHQDSPVFYFHLTPRQIGKISIIVELYQEVEWLGSARLHTTAQTVRAGSVEQELIVQSSGKVEAIQSTSMLIGIGEDLSDLGLLILTHRRRLKALKLQQAIKGISVDPMIPIEIEDIEDQIATLEERRAKLMWKDPEC